ncbi:MAG: hypothetical protein WBQ89_21005 [Candidatus Acidiferrum sp.]
MDFAETIWTEMSHKYSHRELRMAEQTGFPGEARWVGQQLPFVQGVWIAEP